jgi:hypothetical protein
MKSKNSPIQARGAGWMSFFKLSRREVGWVAWALVVFLAAALKKML